MEYTRLGSSGLTISRIALGTMSYGDGGSRPLARRGRVGGAGPTSPKP